MPGGMRANHHKGAQENWSNEEAEKGTGQVGVELGHADAENVLRGCYNGWNRENINNG
jgi:hypothetical protein